MKMMLAPVLALAFGSSFALAGGPADKFTLAAQFVPAAKGKTAAVAVTFTSLDPDVHINQEPAPRIKLGEGQTVLLDRQPPAASRLSETATELPRYLDLSVPVSFSVAIAPEAPKGSQSVPLKVSYFFCSKREGWCRKGNTELEVALSVP